MARTANVFARVEPELKEQAESVLDRKYVIIRICQQLYFSDTLFS